MFVFLSHSFFAASLKTRQKNFTGHLCVIPIIKKSHKGKIKTRCSSCSSRYPEWSPDNENRVQFSLSGL